MKAFQQSSASYHWFFYMVDSTDHVSAKTGLSPTVTLSKNGAAFASPAGAVSEVGNGWYKLAANATDRNTLGQLLLHATATGADPTDDSCLIVAFDPFDAVRAGLMSLPNANAGANGGLPTGDASARVTLTPTTIQAIWDALTSALTMSGSIGKRIVDYLTGDVFARLGAPAGASISADVAAIKTDTGNLATRIPSALNIAGGVVDADAVKISTDATAANNLEAALDGTGGVQLKLKQLYIDAAAGETAVFVRSTSGIGVDVDAYYAAARLTSEADGASAVVLFAEGDSAHGLLVTATGPNANAIFANAQSDGGKSLVLSQYDASLATETLSAQDALSNIDDRISAIGAAQVSVISPIAVPSQAISLYQGDSYYGTKTQQLSWNIPLALADLTGATATFKLKHSTLFTKSLTISGAGVDGTQVLSLALTAAETANMTEGANYKYELEVSWAASAEVRTVVVGVATITPQLS
jgi:hypothetical protein